MDLWIEAATPPDQQERVDPLEWAEAHRYFDAGAQLQQMEVPAPLREIYLDLSPRIAFMKGAQIGASEWGINRALWVADQGHALRGNALYVLPGGQHVGDFVQARVNPAIQNSHYLLGRIRQGDTKDPDKVGLRRIGRGYTYFRTSGSRAGLRTVDADLLVLDEFDEMAEWVLPMAEHRLDSSRHPMIVVLGTPTHPGVGIDREYLDGDQRRYEVRCLNCDTWQVLDWDRSVDIAGDPVEDADCVALLVCVDCRDDLTISVERAWTHGDNARWRPLAPEHLYHSYHLSQLYRPGVDLVAIARSLRAASTEAQREAWNQSLGLPNTEAGGRLSEAELRRTAVGPRMAALAATTGTQMGVDVGARLHCFVSKVIDGLPTMVAAFEVNDFDELDRAMVRWGVRHCVVDAHPELHGAESFQQRHRGRVWLCNYVLDRWPFTWSDAYDAQGTQIRDVRRQYRVDSDRTAIMDAVADRVRGEDGPQWGWQPRIALAADAETVPGLFAQLTAPERRTVRTPSGRIRGAWDEGSRPDHYFHALVYAELAGQIAEQGPRQSEFVWV